MKSAETHGASHRAAGFRRRGEGADRGMRRRVYAEIAGYRLVALGLLVIELLATPLFLLAPIPLAIAVDSVLGDKPLPGVVDAIVPDAVTPTQLLAVAAVLQVVVVLLTDLQMLAQNVLRTRTQEQLTLRLRSRLLAHVQRLSFAFHDRRGPADSLYRIQFDSTALGTMLVTNLLPLVSAAFTLVAVFVVIVGINTQLALIALATTPFLAVLSNRSKRQMRGHYRESKKLESSAIGVVHEVLGNVRVVKAFGREDSEHQRFVRQADASARKRVGIAAREGVLNLAINFITAAGAGLVLFVGAQSVLSGAISLGALLVVLSYLTRLYTPLKTLTRRVTGMQNAYESLERAFELLDQEPDVAERPDARPVRRARGDIDFDRVSFAYEGEPPVLEDVSLRVPAGTRIGVVGRTGAGKTTLVSLLMRFYDVSSGAVSLDGVDVRDLRLADLRNQFAIVLQEPVLFSTSIADNIRYGRLDASPDEVRQAARAAGIEDFIDRLPEGYDTVVGERGQRLSGGERQRIALARAFLKNAPILVLDEPTSSVDVATEASIMDALDSLARGRTTFMIAHRLSTLDRCDVIVRIEDGRCRVVGDGRTDPPPDGPPEGFRPQGRLPGPPSLAGHPASSRPAEPVASAESVGESRGDGQAAAEAERANPTTVTRELHPAVRAWATLHGAVPAVGPIEALNSRKKGKKGKTGKTTAYRLPGIGPGRQAVIAKRTTLDFERSIYQDVLPSLPLPSLRCYGFLREGPEGWLFIEDAEHGSLDPAVNGRGTEMARWLGTLHGAASGMPAGPCLPDRGAGHYLQRLRASRLLIADNLEHPALPDEDSASAERLLLHLGTLEARWSSFEHVCQDAPSTLVHGDLEPKNYRFRMEHGQVVVLPFDWETAGWGVPAADLARMPQDPHGPEMQAYLSAVRVYWPQMNMATVQRLAAVGFAFRLVASIYWAACGLDRPWIERSCRQLRYYEPELRSIVERGSDV